MCTSRSMNSSHISATLVDSELDTPRQATLSVAIIARDEERYIAAALASSSALAAEVLVLIDERTRDHTAAICHAYGARVLVEPWRGFSSQRNRALDCCVGDWVLFLDADERITPALSQEILHVLHSNTSSAGYWIPRYNSFFGRTVRGGGWYPDYQLRLLRRGRAQYDETCLVHEFALLDGEAEYLNEHLLHLNIEQLGELWRKQ